MLNNTDDEQPTSPKEVAEELQIHNLALRDLVNAYLGIELDDHGLIIDGGHKFGSISIPKHIADKIFALTLNKPNPARAFIEYPSEDNGFMRQPKLWDWATWIDSNEKFQILKKESHGLRVTSYLLEENVFIVSRAVMDVLGMDMKRAKGYAYQLLKKKNAKALIHAQLGTEVQILETEEDLKNYRR